MVELKSIVRKETEELKIVEGEATTNIQKEIREQRARVIWLMLMLQ